MSKFMLLLATIYGALTVVLIFFSSGWAFVTSLLFVVSILGSSKNKQTK